MVARFFAVIVVVAVLLVPLEGWAQSREGIPPIMALKDVKPGMRGIARTVIKGQKVEEFNIEVLGILQGGGGIIPVKHLVLFRASGPLTDQTGGTAAGMSGSPLYINGKLIGALSAGYLWQPGKRDLALATPIEEMLPLLDIPAGAPQSVWPRTFVANPPVRIGSRLVDRIVIASDVAQAERIDAARLRGTTAFIPAAFPVTISGLSPRAQRLVEQALGLKAVLQAYGGEPTSFPVEPVTGGSSIGVEQVHGDVSYGGICSVTLRVGDKLLICGHPWDNLGDVEYALTASNIITVVRTLQEPFKEGNLGDVIGKIDQDRGPGIRGIVGRMPRLFAVRVGVTNLDTGQRIDKGMQVVRRGDLAKVFATAMALTVLDRARDQALGGGSARVKITLRGKGLPRPITRENLFYNSRDVALASLLEMPDALNFMFHNDLTAIDPIDVSMEVAFTAKRQTAAVTDVQVERREVAPGERLRVRLMVRPFQEESVQSRTIEIEVPRNYPRGPAVLAVGSAGVSIPVEFPLEQRLSQFLQREPEPSQAQSLDEAIDLFEDFGKNTDVLIRILPFGLPTDSGEFLKFDVFAGRIVRTDWVVQGTIQIPILIR